MTDDQFRAVEKLKKALTECGEAGLKGGVFDSSFCIWPTNINPIESGGADDLFFEEVAKHGEILLIPAIHLDGGAGI